MPENILTLPEHFSPVRRCVTIEEIQGGDMMNDRSWDRLSGLIIGAALGVVAGILMAPGAGEDTRGTLKQKTQDSLDQFQSSVRDIRDSLTQKGQTLFKKAITEIPLDDADMADSNPHEDQGA